MVNEVMSTPVQMVLRDEVHHKSFHRNLKLSIYQNNRKQRSREEMF